MEEHNKDNIVQIERRKYPRYDFPYPIKYRQNGDQNDYTTSLSGNISLGGIMIFSKNLLKLNNDIDLLISYSIDNKQHNLNLQGIIVWIQEVTEQNKWKNGIHFQNVTNTQLIELEKFIQGYCKKSTTMPKNFEAKDAREYFIRGVQNFETDLESALLDFTNAIKMDPTHVAAYYYSAFAKDRLGDSKGAEEDWKKYKDLQDL